MELLRRIAFLKQVSIFTETPEKVLMDIAQNLTEMEVSEGDHIVLKGELGDAMYIIIDGRVKVHDDEYIFSILKKGDVFGKYYLLDKKERSATVTALSHTFLFRFTQELFYSVTQNENTIIKGVLRALVHRLRDMNIAEEQLASQNHEIIRQKEELERQKKELLELNATKDKFFSIIAHDLRSPISTLITLSESLRTDMEMLSPEQNHEILSGLYDLSRNYLKLLDNLLQWSQIQTGRLTPKPERIELKTLVEEVAGFYKVFAFEKQVTLYPDLSSPVEVYADRNMVKTIIRNLVSNAIKYSVTGGRVEISFSASGSLATIIVRDNGLGMTSEMVSKLFRLDQTFSTAGTANEKGTGLGLILCKEFTEKNGGTISVESKRGYGSAFVFTLPLFGDNR